MTDYIIQFDLKKQNQTEHSRFWGQQSAFFLKKKKKLSQENCTNSSNTENIYKALFFFS